MYPSTDYILENWMSVNDVAALKNVVVQTVTYACRAGNLRCRQIGKVWYIDPDSAAAYEPKEMPRGYKMPRRATARAAE